MKLIWRVVLSLPLRVLTTVWRSCVRSRRVGPSRTKSSETPSVSPRRKWCLMPTRPSCRGERDEDQSHRLNRSVSQTQPPAVLSHLFDKCKKKTLCIWPDYSCQPIGALQALTLSLLLVSYRCANISFTKNPEKYHKYRPEEVEDMIEKLFDTSAWAAL